jgi:hypothetical protein
MQAMLAARMARTLSKTGAKKDCAHQLDVARAALDKGTHDDDTRSLYWVTIGEIKMIAGLCALQLGDPAEAVRRFEAAIDASYPGDEEYPRSHAIYLARTAEAHLEMRDLDAAAANARHAARRLGSSGGTPPPNPACLPHKALLSGCCRSDLEGCLSNGSLDRVTTAPAAHESRTSAQLMGVEVHAQTGGPRGAVRPCTCRSRSSAI